MFSKAWKLSKCMETLTERKFAMGYQYRSVTVRGRVYQLLLLTADKFPCSISKVLRAALATRRRDNDKDHTIYYWVIFPDAHNRETVHKFTQAALKEELGRRNKMAKPK